MNKAYLQWVARQLPRYIGILGLAGLGLLAFAGLLYLQDLKPYQSDLANRQLEIDQKSRTLNQVKAAGTIAASQVNLYRDDTFTFFLRKLNDTASALQIGLNQVDYKSQQEADGRLRRYSMLFPVSGRYMQIRRFIAALETVPGIRVEALNMQRQQIGQDQLSVQLQLSYLTEVQ